MWPLDVEDDESTIPKSGHIPAKLTDIGIA